jgi:prophage antirepressor-like protein
VALPSTTTPVRIVVAGQSVRATQHEGAFWLTAEQVADVLGFARGSNVMKVYRRNAAEFQAIGVCEVVLDSPASVGGGRVVTCFAPRALVHFACLARTEKARAFRRLVSEPVERGSVGAAGAELLDAAIKSLEAERDSLPKREAVQREALDDAAALAGEAAALVALTNKDINKVAERHRIPMRRDW